MSMFSFWYFFFFKQKTAYEMRISYWSSDVCSSDLIDPEQLAKMEEQLKKLEFENMQLKLANKDKTEDRKVDWYDAETQRIRALSDHDVDANEMEMRAIQQILDGSKSLDEFELKKADLIERNEIARNKPTTPADRTRLMKEKSGES